MEVILLERVAKLGQIGDIVRVKDGFAGTISCAKAKRCGPPKRTAPGSRT
jgi:ribosomal protein L9